MHDLEAIHRTLDELAISLHERDVVLHMHAFNREVMMEYSRVLEQMAARSASAPNGKSKETAQKP